ncbi:MAG: contractile injection system protein, VgrG/Pvc8 family, partial [Geminicoccaceae bacterium]|nr:contractile injection system protein, VgrG/Pvc8 family [Geminicoccaceae bacterium]
MSVRLVTMRAAAAPDALLFHRMHGREELGRPFRYELEALSEKDDLSIRDLLGTGVSVTIGRRDGSERHIHGLVARAEFRGSEGALRSLRPRPRALALVPRPAQGLPDLPGQDH